MQIESWKASGFSVRKFCQVNFVTESSFRAWRRELALRDRESSKSPVIRPTTAALKLKPIFDRMHEILLQSKAIETDDTPTKVQDRKKKKNIKIGRVWIYRGDDDHPVNLFDYTEGRGRAGPMSFLPNFQGYLLGDCFSGNLALCAATGAIFVACRAHGRRYFIKAQPNNKKACDEILQMFAELFEIEHCA